MTLWQQFLSVEIEFQAFGGQHLGALIVFGLCMLATVWGIRNFDTRQSLLFSRIISIFLVITVALFSAIKIYFDRFNLLIDRPISLCNLFAILAPLLFWRPNQRRLEVLYFLIMAGTVQAMLTPDLYVGFPSNEFFKYWIVHGGLVVLVIHNIFAFQMYPRLKGVVITFAWVNVYSIALYGLNLLMDANYFYLVSKPGNASILDLFGPWPLYILVAEMVAMVFFALFYLPFIFIKKTDSTGSAV
jgi:hypothetical integral membrane protein (TIGR02206 family)